MSKPPIFRREKLTLLAGALLGLGVIALLVLTNTGNLLKTQVAPNSQGKIVICSHVTCAETTAEGVETQCRRAVVRCSSPSCNAGPCTEPDAPPPPAPDRDLVPVRNRSASLPPSTPTADDGLIPVGEPTQPSPDLTPVNATDPTNPTLQPAVTIETNDDERKLWQELGIITVSLFRHLGQAVITLFNQI